MGELMGPKKRTARVADTKKFQSAPNAVSHHGLESLAGTSPPLAEFLCTSGAIKLIESYNRLSPPQKFAVLDLVTRLAE